MPLKLVPPRPGKSPYWYVRGTHRGIAVDRSTKETNGTAAGRWLKRWREDIDSGQLSRPGEPTFLDAAVAYMAATSQERFLQPIIDRIGGERLGAVDQAMIDAAAIALYPTASPATRNRQVYTVVSAVLKHAGRAESLRRPKGAAGNKRIEWMRPDQAFRLIEAAGGVDREFQVFLTTLLYTGMRLSEALSLTVDRLDLGEGYAFLPKTKNGEPRTVFLPPVVVAALANHPRGMERQGKRVFRFSKAGRLYTWLGRAKKKAGPDLDTFSFHSFRHTWATWMRRYAGLDTAGLVETGAWRDRKSAARYEHAVATEESMKAGMLPTAATWKKTGAA